MHSKFNIPSPNNFLSLLPIVGFTSPCFLLVNSYIDPYECGYNSSKSTKISHYTHREGTRQSPMHVHDVAGKSAIFYPHHEGV